MLWPSGADMETMQLRLNVGEHEFEADGPAEIVQAQFAAWRALIAPVPAPAAAPPAQAPAAPPTEQPDLHSGPAFNKIMRQHGRVVSLTARGDSLKDELRLLLLGQKHLRGNVVVSGAELVEGLRQTGRTVTRIDYELDKMSDAGDVIVTGHGRGRRYRLTNTGLAKAQDLARTVLAKFA